MKIPRGTIDTPGPCWLPAIIRHGRPQRPMIKCRCGCTVSIDRYDVEASGRVVGHFFHLGRGCTFYEELQLEGYDQGAFPHAKPIA